MARTLQGSLNESFAANIKGKVSISRDMAWGDSEKTNLAPFIVGGNKTLTSVTAFSANGFGNWIARVIISKNTLIAPIESVTPLSNTLTVTGHGYSVNDLVVFVGDGTLPLPLQYGLVYFVQSVPTIDTFTLAYTSGGSVVDITSTGLGNINIEPVIVSDLAFGIPNATVVSMTSTDDQITVTGHGLSVGDPIQFTGDGTLAAPLEFEMTYFVHSVVDANTITLSSSLNGTLLNLTSSSSGVIQLSYKNEGLITASPNIGLTAGDSIRFRFVSQGSSVTSPQMECLLT